MPDAPLTFGFDPPAALFDLAAELRQVIDKMLVIDDPGDEVGAARAEVAAIAARLERIGRRGHKARLHPSIPPGPDDDRPYYAANARRWHCNPLFPPITFDTAARGLRGRLQLGITHEGPPGCVHGGVVALLLDQFLGQSNVEAGVPAMTGSLTVRFRRPTPLWREIIVEADGPERADDRRCLTRGRITCDGEITAEAQGLFVLPRGIDLPVSTGGVES